MNRNCENLTCHNFLIGHLGFLHHSCFSAPRFSFCTTFPSHRPVAVVVMVAKEWNGYELWLDGRTDWLDEWFSENSHDFPGWQKARNNIILPAQTTYNTGRPAGTLSGGKLNFFDGTCARVVKFFRMAAWGKCSVEKRFNSGSFFLPN